MARNWPVIAVRDVVKSATWYAALLNAQDTHPGKPVFTQILDRDGTVLICIHHWGPSGPRGDHHWPPLSSPQSGAVGNGLLLWFVVQDFDAAWERAGALKSTIAEQPNTDNGVGTRAFMLQDPDGYYVVINEARA